MVEVAVTEVVVVVVVVSLAGLLLALLTRLAGALVCCWLREIMEEAFFRFEEVV